MVQNNYIIFSDLDGTLLDHNTYSYAPAKEALNRIREVSIPLILVSSKTRQELLHYQNELELTGFPFVVENGSAFYTPPGYFKKFTNHRQNGDLWEYILGLDVVKIRNALEEISKKHAYEIRGFHNSTPEEISRRTGLSQQKALSAMKREFSIPVFFDTRTEKILQQEVNNYGLSVLYGGRFIHVLGGSNKGACLKKIMLGFRQKYSEINLLSIALGDSLNDFAMLEAADYPVLVKKFDGRYEDRAGLDRLIYSPEAGPAGWNRSVLALLNNQNLAR